MKNHLEKSSTPEALRSEHLKAGEKPILACVGTLRQFDEFATKGQSIFRHKTQAPKTLNVDYCGNVEHLTAQGIKKPCEESYVISPVDESDKYSMKFYDCTGVIVAGKDKKTGENISFLCHQNPKYFLINESNLKKFTEDLKDRLAELYRRCAEGTIDAIVFGGNYFRNESEYIDIGEDASIYRRKYKQSINFLSKIISETLGFKPAIATGPKNTEGSENISYDNKERKLYIIRPEVGDKSTESYSPTELSQQGKKW